MSLHGKVVAWFALFATVIVTMFVLGDYYQSTRALRVALEARAGALARGVAIDTERRYEGALLELSEIGHGVAGSGEPTVTDRFDDYSSIRIFEDGELVWQRAGEGEELDPLECAAGVIPFTVEFADASGSRYRVEATMGAPAFFSRIASVTARIGNTGITSVIDSQTGQLIYDNGCVIRSNAVPALLAHDLGRHVQAQENRLKQAWTAELAPEDDRMFLVAIARADHPAWAAAVGLDYDKWVEPFAATRTQFLAVMLVIMAIALLLTLHMIRGEMKRLSAISRAADAIGHGRFDVWLPPPTGDEIGRLSLALGQMVNRLSSTIRQMEINAAMAAVGEMATYLSHEIRNPLSSIRLNLQMLQRDLRKGSMPSDGEQLVSLCLTEMQRLSDVVSTVLDVGRNGSRDQSGVCDAHEVVNDTVNVMKSKFSAQGVAVELKLGAVDCDVACDAAKLKSVLINLLLNSVEAMAAAPQRAITITTEQVEAPEGMQLELSVLDTGPGVPGHLQAKIFEPFFTTKATGSGIGLATVVRIVRECGGSIRCRSADENQPGGEFIVTLPLAGSITRTTSTPPLVAAG